MTSREKILSAVREAQPALRPLPDLSPLVEAANAASASAQASAAPGTHITGETTLDRFTRTLEAIGGKVYSISHPAEMISWIQEHTARGQRVLSSLAELSEVTESIPVGSDPHDLENVGLAILRGHFGVAENGAIWITEDQMGIRALPFITEHLALVISATALVDHMHAAYQRITHTVSGFGAFIAGPSKTADIEQSLVLGAHGPVGMSVFIIRS
jgi:L-lactate dehydrogenase complex protein LldG